MTTRELADKIQDVLLKTRHYQFSLVPDHICKGTPVSYDYEFLFSEIESLLTAALDEARRTQIEKDAKIAEED